MSSRDGGVSPRGITSTAIRRPIGTLAIASVVFVLGLFYFDRLPVDLLPNVEYPQIRVTVNYPGAAPEVMEQQVTRVLERNLAAVENLVTIDSRASQGRTNVNLIFELGTNLDLAIQDAARYMELARTQLPLDIEPPRLYKFDPAQDPVWQAGFSSSVRSEVEVRDWVENQLAPQLIAIHGVSGVEAAGGMVREVEVIVDQDRLHAYGLGMQHLVTALQDENVDIAAGWMTSTTFDVMAKTDGMFTSVDDIRQVLLDLPANNARRIPLSEVAEIRDGHREQRVLARLNGTPSAQVSVFKLPDANTVDVVDSVNDTMARLERSGFLPADIQYETVSDPAFFIRGSINSVASAAILGGVLAMLMVFMFLGSLRKSFVIGLSIPIAVMATFAMMGAGGLTLNIISLGGLALGVGLLLDNAIVMLENIYRHRERLGKSPDQAAHDGAREVVSAITAGTLTNLAAVLPFLLITGLAALVFRDLILTISFAIIATLAAAVTLVPMLAALLGAVRFESGLQRSLPLRLFNRFIAWLRRVYRRALPRILRLRWAVVAVAALLFVGATQVLDELGNEFLPVVDDGNVDVRVWLPPGTPPDETDAVARAAEETVQGMPHVESMFTIVGGHLSGGVINERPGTIRSSVQLAPLADRPDMSAGRWVAEAQSRLEALDLPGARVSVRPPRIDGLRFTTRGDDFSIGVMGENLEQLQGKAAEILTLLEGIPGLEGVEIGREDQSPLMRVSVDRARAADLGLRVSDVGRAVRDAVDGAVPTQYMTANREYDIRVRLPSHQVEDPDALGDLMLFRNNGVPVRLRDVASFTLGEGPAHIERENQSRVVRVNGDLNTEIADVGSIMATVEQRMAGLEVPDEISLIYGGQWETIQETNREMRMVILLAVFLVFVVLAVQYERLSNPLVIITAAPLSLIGVVGLLWLTSTPVSAPVLIGMILLIGIVVNNAILLVEYIEIGRREKGLSVSRAVVAAGTIRLRPILMTTSTTVLGMLPLAIGIGEGAEIMRPLATAVVGGLSVSMLLTLVVVPCLYLILGGFAERLKTWLTGRTPQTAKIGA
ncbi:CzcA family heavy metal efflux pump [Natronocella acetinitrilica]|uniref:CzcA family heavy metal efflux pump n=1 Tax=Natronocella acetinitrilica TaxID=414046 RepID=A0AAE3G545_9GAMM|nr:efflux RND transporter permease subunit [Natronocella acetinitrilica]MCP1674022.1 CzcA family heavy metal efflux pump [Natronocella acetinitrilica]